MEIESGSPLSRREPAEATGSPVRIGGIPFGAGVPLAVIAGPCVIESRELLIRTGGELAEIARRAGVPIVFKSSYDKANRTSISSFRGPGLDEGLAALEAVRAETGLPVMSDVHSPEEARIAGEVLDALQIPAFLCRQTDLLIAAAETGRPVNVKKGQFLSPWDAVQIIEKLRAAGNDQILITERGTTFGYRNLVVDMRALAILAGFGVPVVFDATHAVQIPGGQGDRSGGEREFVPILARAAVAAGCHGVFMEVHPDPDTARCDGPNMIPLADVERLVVLLRRLSEVVSAG